MSLRAVIIGHINLLESINVNNLMISWTFLESIFNQTLFINLINH